MAAAQLCVCGMSTGAFLSLAYVTSGAALRTRCNPSKALHKKDTLHAMHFIIQNLHITLYIISKLCIRAVLCSASAWRASVATSI